MNTVDFELEGVKIRFESSNSGSVVVGKSGGKEAELLDKAVSVLDEAAQGTKKLVEFFLTRLTVPSVESFEIELGLKLEGEVGFIFVNSKAEAAITIKATVKPPKD